MSDKLRAAAKAALEMLNDYRDCLQAANILRVGLAEPAIKESLTVAEQEPVAWTTMPEAEDWCFVSSSKDPTGKLEGKWFPLYTAPPRREWVGLTHDERVLVTEFAMDDIDVVIRAEAKLREKNT